MGQERVCSPHQLKKKIHAEVLGPPQYPEQFSSRALLHPFEMRGYDMRLAKNDLHPVLPHLEKRSGLTKESMFLQGFFHKLPPGIC